MSRERCEEIMRRYLTEVVMEGKLEVIKEIAAEDMVDHVHPTLGREGLERHAGGFLAGAPKKEIFIEQILANEDTAVGLWGWRGTFEREIQGIPAGTKVECRSASVFTVRDGLLVYYWVASPRPWVLE